MGYLTFEKRNSLKNLLNQGLSVQAIAKELGVTRSTVYNELNRGKDETGSYNPIFSEEQFQVRQQGKGRSPILKEYPELAAYISNLILQNQTSPKQIVKILEESTPNKENLSISANTIYSAIDKGLIPGVTRESLQSNRTKMFSNGMVCIPKWVRERLSFCDGDIFSVEIQDDGTVILKKQSE